MHGQHALPRVLHPPAPNMALPTSSGASMCFFPGSEKVAAHSGAAAERRRYWKAGMVIARALPITNAREGSQAGRKGERNLQGRQRAAEVCVCVWVCVGLCVHVCGGAASWQQQSPTEQLAGHSPGDL